MEVAEPSVITLNVLSAAQAVNDLMMMFSGLYADSVQLPHQLNFVRERELNNVEPIVKAMPRLRRSRKSGRQGRSKRLPCRMPIRGS